MTSGTVEVSLLIHHSIMGRANYGKENIPPNSTAELSTWEQAMEYVTETNGFSSTTRAKNKIPCDARVRRP